MDNSINKELGSEKAISETMEKLLFLLGEDVSRSGIKDTPTRAARSLIELTSGRHLTASDVVGNGIFPCESEGMILQKDIEFYSLCEHHLLPFFGKVHIAYYPDKKIMGLSKLGRIIDIYAKRLQVQESLTFQIKAALENILQPKGVAVVVEAYHFCMMMRGVKKQGSQTTTSEFSGIFDEDHTKRMEFLHSIK